MRIFLNSLVVVPQLHVEIIWGSFEKTTKGSHPKPFTSESGPRREVVFHSSQEIPTPGRRENFLMGETGGRRVAPRVCHNQS